MSHGRVLVVEDDPSIRRLTKTVLETQGYEVFEVVDGPSALPAAREARPDVVLLDVGLPGMDGFGVLSLLKEDEELRDVPVMMVTAWAEPELVAKALDRGAHDYIRKPFDITDLAARVDAAVRIKAAQDLISSDNERLAEIATVDPLTSLPNRLQLTLDLERQVALSGRSKQPFSAIVFDLDHFKLVNDTYGHATGDEVLRAVARRLMVRTRRGDLFGRWGGEEFLVVAPNTDVGGAGALAEDLRTALADRPIDLPGCAVRTTASFGAAEWRGGSWEQLLEAADRALFQAKDSGRNTVRLADTAPAAVPVVTP